MASSSGLKDSMIFAYALVYPAQLHIDVLAMAEVDDAHGEHFGFRSVCFQHAIAQDVCAGVNLRGWFVFVAMACLVCVNELVLRSF